MNPSPTGLDGRTALKPLKDTIGKRGIANPDIRYFKLPLDEAYQIAKRSGRVDTVYAVLNLEHNPGIEVPKDSRRIDLLFYVQPTQKEAEINAEGTFFDFTDPCPTSCDTIPPWQ